MKCLFQVTNMTHSDSVHTGGCCCHRIFMQFDEIKNELQNVRQTVGVAVTLLSVSRKWCVVEASYLPLQNLDTQTHNVSRVQNSIEQMCLILMCCSICKVYYETFVKCQVVIRWLIGNENLYSQWSAFHQWWVVYCQMPCTHSCHLEGTWLCCAVDTRQLFVACCVCHLWIGVFMSWAVINTN